MKKKLNINEGEIQRILGLHKKAILEESKFIIAEEANTFKVVSPLKLEPTIGMSSSSYDGIKIWNAVFKPSTKIKNSLVTTKKVIVQSYDIVGETVREDNKAYVVYNCKKQTAYVIGSTNKKSQKLVDYKTSKRVYDMKGFQSLQKLCKEATVRDEIVVKPDKDAGTENPKLGNENPNTLNQKDGTYQGTSRGNRYTFDYDAVMKAIDDTGKCGVFGTSSGTSSTSGVAGTSGTSGTQGVSGVVTQTKPKVSREDFITWTAD